MTRPVSTNPAVGVREDFTNHFKLYVAGGMFEAANGGAASYEPTLEVFNSKSNKWTVMGSMLVEFSVRLTGPQSGKELGVPMGDTLEFATLVPCDGKVAVVGGTHDGNVLVWELGDGDEWILIERMPLELAKRFAGSSTKCAGIEGGVCLYKDIAPAMVVWRRVKNHKNKWEWCSIDGCNTNRNAKFAAFEQEIDSLKQTLSKHVKENESLLTTFIVFKKESKENENKYIDKEIDLEKKVKELNNIVYKVGQSAQTVHMLTKPQAFWLPLLNPKSEQLVVPQTLVKIEVPKELPKENDNLFELLLSQDIVHICVNSFATRTDCHEMQQSFIDAYNETLELKAQLAKKEHMVEKIVFNELVLRCSRLKNQCLNLELKLQHQKESFLNNRPLNNQDAPDIQEFFHINEWQAKLKEKDVSIANWNKHIENLKGKNVVEKDVPPKNAKVIAPGMFRLDLEPLAPRVLKSRDAHIDYIKHTQEHANILWELVEHA
ncbi:retrovirus-related pol polyprotein from transposon TNT 1-94 [Tanacetum coccineum]